MDRIAFAISLIAGYIAEQVKSAKGSVVTVDAKRISRWYRAARFGEEMPRRLKHAATYVLKQLYSEGYIEKIGGKYAVRKGSKLWTPEADELAKLIRSAVNEGKKNAVEQ